MKIGWVLGWAIPEGWFAEVVREVFTGFADPDRNVAARGSAWCSHLYVAAAPDALDALERAGPFDWIVGYSLGSLLLLKEAERAEKLGKMALLAPILAFASEEGLGGRVARAQVKYLRRWMEKDREAALVDFYGRAGLNAIHPPPSGGGHGIREIRGASRQGLEVPRAPARGHDDPGQIARTLQWGLERLQGDRVEPPLPAGWRAWCGAEDALLDAGRLQALDSRIRVVPGATHHPGGLIRAFAKECATS